MAKLRKIGFLADVHNDLDGLCRALDVLRDCDRIFHLGDLIEDDPEANAVLELLTGRNITGVVGYHDELALTTGSHIDQRFRSYLEGLPRQIVRGDFYLVHDNPLSKEKGEGLTAAGGYIRDEYTAGRVFEESVVRILVVGHTHRAEQYVWADGNVEKCAIAQLALDPARRYILNPGSVCNQFRGTAPSVGVFDLARSRFEIRLLQP